MGRACKRPGAIDKLQRDHPRPERQRKATASRRTSRTRPRRTRMLPLPCPTHTCHPRRSCSSRPACVRASMRRGMSCSMHRTAPSSISGLADTQRCRCSPGRSLSVTRSTESNARHLHRLRADGEHPQRADRGRRACAPRRQRGTGKWLGRPGRTRPDVARRSQDGRLSHRAPGGGTTGRRGARHRHGQWGARCRRGSGGRAPRLRCGGQRHRRGCGEGFCRQRGDGHGDARSRLVARDRVA